MKFHRKIRQKNSNILNSFTTILEVLLTCCIASKLLIFRDSFKSCFKIHFFLKKLIPEILEFLFWDIECGIIILNRSCHAMIISC